MFAVPVAPTWVEMKLIDGRLSKEQKEVPAHMKAMGYAVHTVWAESPVDGRRQAKALLPDIEAGIQLLES